MNTAIADIRNIASDGDANFIKGTGEMASLIRALDWSNSPLGPISSWPQSLRTTVSLCLASNVPINIIWGPEHTQIYNDAYRIACGDKHPGALGADYRECWEWAWPVIGKRFERALKGETSFLENQRMFIFRNDRLEEAFFSFSLSPIRDESGEVGGLFHPIMETTGPMVVMRRTDVVRELAARLADVVTPADVFRLTTETLSGFDLDLPFVLLYELVAETKTYRLAGSTGIEGFTCLNPASLSVPKPGIWPVEQLLKQVTAAEVRGLRALLGDMPCGPYAETPELALAMPIRQPGNCLPVALLIAGASARLPWDSGYRGFFELLGATFNAALSRTITR